MKYLSLIAMAVVALANPQVTSIISPKSPPPNDCSATHNGAFEIAVVAPPTSKRTHLAKRDDLVLSLSNGILKDKQGRTGYIASNYQFQFDGPPQTGAIYTAGFSMCSNGSLALGGSTVFYQCLSGNFYNLYDRYWAAQCQPIELLSQPVDASISTSALAGSSTGISGTMPSAGSVVRGSDEMSVSSTITESSTQTKGPSTSMSLPRVTGPTPAAPPASTTSAKANSGNRAGHIAEGVAMVAGLAAVVLA